MWKYTLSLVFLTLTSIALLTGADNPELISISHESGATKTNVTGESNWAAVKATDGFVVIRATITPTPASIPAGSITWSGGVAGDDQFHRKVSKSTSVKTEVTATYKGQTTPALNVWILWAAVEIKTSGTTPKNAVQFGTRYDGTENLGAQYYDNNNKAVGKVVPIATITPAGVNDIVKSGWTFKRERWCHDFVDGVQSAAYWETAWTDDTSSPSFQKLVPDSDDKIYDRDAPSIGIATVTSSYETYSNFREWIEWNADLCSDRDGGHWHWKAWKKNDQTPQVTLKEVQDNNITLPGGKDAHYK